MKFDPRKKYICYCCVGEKFLSNEIESTNKKLSRKRKCSYCHKKEMTITIQDIGDRIEKAITEHYIKTSDQPDDFQYAMLRDKESSYDWEREGQDITNLIFDLAGVSREIAEDIQAYLEDKNSSWSHHDEPDIETEFSSESHYTETKANGNEYHQLWNKLEQSLKEEARYFNHKVMSTLEEIFSGLDTMNTFNNKPLLKYVGVDTKITHLYRARSFENFETMEKALVDPENLLGPPATVYSGSGRMNARGISVFYGANTRETAISEIRPSVGSQVLTTKFDITSKLKVLDLRNLDKISPKGSLFDPVFTKKINQVAFLKNLKERIVSPVLPSAEAFDYLTTQAVAEFLEQHPIYNVDGILYPSVQSKNDDFNLVIFHKSSKIKFRTPSKKEFKVMSYFNDEYEMCVLETELKIENNDNNNDNDNKQSESNFTECLSIDVGSIHLHEISGVKYSFSSEGISWRTHQNCHFED